MKVIKTVCYCIFTLMPFMSNAQVNNASQNLKDQAMKMGAAFAKEDYKAFILYNYKPMVQAQGGAAKMEAVLQKTMSGMKAQGMIVSGITVDEPSKIVKSGKELQATIGQHTAFKLPTEKVISTSTLIAFSTDNGLTWTFVDTSNKDIATMRKLLPHLSAAIILPPPSLPVRAAL